jgi:hypothetical protein
VDFLELLGACGVVLAVGAIMAVVDRLRERRLLAAPPRRAARLIRPVVRSGTRAGRDRAA